MLPNCQQFWIFLSLSKRRWYFNGTHKFSSQEEKSFHVKISYRCLYNHNNNIYTSKYLYYLSMNIMIMIIIMLFVCIARASGTGTGVIVAQKTMSNVFGFTLLNALSKWMIVFLFFRHLSVLSECMPPYVLSVTVVLMANGLYDICMRSMQSVRLLATIASGRWNEKGSKDDVHDDKELTNIAQTYTQTDCLTIWMNMRQ